MTPANPEPRVVIAGGGPGGLLCSILLNNIGISSTVLERAREPDEWSSKSYTLVLGDRGKSALERGGCLESARAAGIERRFIYFLDGQTGDTKTIPKQSPGLGFTRPLLVQCLEEKVANECPRVTLKRGVGVSSVSRDGDSGLKVHLEDGTAISATNVVGADGKWSKVRQSFESLSSQSKMMTSPSFGVHIDAPSAPDGFKSDGTYVIKPREECMFYIIASGRPSGGYSISMVCYDETLERYPWLAPPADMKSGEYGSGGWEDEYSALPESMKGESELSHQLELLFQKEVPEFYKILDKESFASARVNRRTTWLKVSGDGGEKVSYSTGDGEIALIGDACHAMVSSRHLF